jgi:MerR family transcriptional regulator, light-induced transcriptional regulator
MNKHPIEIESNQFLNALLTGNKHEAHRIANLYANSNEEIKILYEQVIKPALYKVGEKWENNLISVAAEHLATSIAEMVMNDLFEQIISLERKNNKVLLGCVENEYHQVGIKMIGDMFEMHGWNTYFLGANIPTRDLIDYAIDNEIELIGLSISIYFHFDKLIEMIKAIQAELPNALILVGGQAFTHGGKDYLTPFKRVLFIEDLNQLDSFIKTFEKP